MYIGIPAIVATQSFPLIRLCIIIILIATLIEMLTHIVTLNVEADASFNKETCQLLRKNSSGISSIL